MDHPSKMKFYYSSDLHIGDYTHGWKESYQLHSSEHTEEICGAEYRRSAYSKLEQIVFCNITNLLTLYGLPRITYDMIVLCLKISYTVLTAACRIAIPLPMNNLSDDVVLITGTGKGLGRELAVQLSFLGCTIVCWDSNEYANRATMNAILENGGKVYGFVVDVSNRQEVCETACMMRNAGIPDITILINNSAVSLHQNFLHQNSYQIEETFRVNVMPNFWAIEAFLPVMIQNNKGHIVSVSSVCGLYGLPNRVAYCLTDALHEKFRSQSKGSKINFTTVYPYFFDSELSEGPKYRFPFIFGAVSKKSAAREIVKAIRRNYSEYSIPRAFMILDSINRILPDTISRLILDFLKK